MHINAGLMGLEINQKEYKINRETPFVSRVFVEILALWPVGRTKNGILIEMTKNCKFDVYSA